LSSGVVTLLNSVYGGVQELEEKRKAKSKVFCERKKQLYLKATKRVEEQLSSLQETLVPISYTS